MSILQTDFKASFEISGLRKLDLSGEALSAIDPNPTGTYEVDGEGRSRGSTRKQFSTENCKNQQY